MDGACISLTTCYSLLSCPFVISCMKYQVVVGAGEFCFFLLLFLFFVLVLSHCFSLFSPPGGFSDVIFCLLFPILLDLESLVSVRQWLETPSEIYHGRTQSSLSMTVTTHSLTQCQFSP